MSDSSGGFLWKLVADTTCWRRCSKVRVLQLVLIPEMAERGVDLIVRDTGCGVYSVSNHGVTSHFSITVGRVTHSWFSSSWALMVDGIEHTPFHAVRHGSNYYLRLCWLS